MSESKDSSDQDDGNKKKSRWGWLKENASLVFDGIVAFMALIGGWFLWAQFALTREQVYKGQRAYLMLHHAVLIEPIAMGTRPHVTIDVTNNGETPALEVSYSIGLARLPVCPSTINYQDWHPLAAIGKDQKLTLVTHMVSPLSAGDIEDLNSDAYTVDEKAVTISARPKLVLFAMVRYKDVFGGVGEAEFSGTYIKSETFFLGCPTHNGIK